MSEHVYVNMCMKNPSLSADNVTDGITCCRVNSDRFYSKRYKFWSEFCCKNRGVEWRGFL